MSTSVNSSVSKAVPTSVAPSTGNSVKVLTTPQLGPLQSPVGERAIPQVERPETMADPGDIDANPGFGGHSAIGMEKESGSAGAPSVPAMGRHDIYIQSHLDQHYNSEFEGTVDPYHKVNNPPTRGMLTWVKTYLNHIALAPQDVDPNGFRTQPPQQRTSVMRITPPPHGDGYDAINQMNKPHQQPQAPNTYKYMPHVGSQAYGQTNQNGAVGSAKGVLNSDQFGAGQTAGGIGGNNYTPTPGPPDTNSTAGSQSTVSMPSWG